MKSIPSKESIKYFSTREAWRTWLAEHFETATEVWFVHPNKNSGKADTAFYTPKAQKSVFTAQ